MSPLSQKIAAALDSRPSPGPGPLVVEEGTIRLHLDLNASGPVGLAFGTLTYSDSALLDCTSETLQGWADRFARRVTYLMEPLVLVELDSSSNEAELRSQTPTARGPLRSFYEVRIQGRDGTLKLSRVSFDETTRRKEPVGCLVTIEVLERLVDDLVASSEPAARTLARQPISR